MAQILTLTKWHTYLLQRGTFRLEMWVPLGPVEYVDLPNTPTSICLATLWPTEREQGKFPLMPDTQIHLVWSICPRGL